MSAVLWSMSGIAMAQSFSDGFEGPQISSFWTASGPGTAGVTNVVSHTGSQSLQLTSVAAFPWHSSLIHDFGSDQTGSVSVYFHLDVPPGGPSATLGIGTSNGGRANVQQLATGMFQSRICSSAASTEPLCTNGVFVNGANVYWHFFEIVAGPAGLAVKLDGVTISADPSVTNFRTVVLEIWGAPTGGTAYYDDFNATLTPPPPIYSVCPLYDASKPVNGGATIPIKLQLCDANGANLSSSSLTVHATGVTKISDQTTGPVQDSGNANPDNDFRFDSSLGGTGGYIFNLSTKGLTTGTYQLNFTVPGDTSSYAALFQVK